MVNPGETANTINLILIKIQIMKTKINSLSVLLLFLISANFVHGQVSSDYDKDVDFSKYQTYTFRGWEKNSDQQLNSFDKERIVNSFKSELADRNLTLDNDNPHLGITLFITLEEKTSRTAYTNYNGGFGYGRSWGYGTGMGSATTTYSESDYIEGTIVIDFYDEETKMLIFQGTLQTTVKEKPKKREKSIPKNIAKLMNKYPVKPSK